MMAFDGAFLSKIRTELLEAVDCHIDKIYQPSKDELVFLLRKKGFLKRLLITVKSGSARIHFTENKFENPDSPPNFCMLLRKYLSSAKLLEINQQGFERVIELIFSASNEMGDLIRLSLICELIGNSANVILVKNDIILDALKHSDVETSQRYILPGAKYEFPKRTEKLNLLEADFKKLEYELLNSEEPSRLLLNKLDGFSPLICREMVFQNDCGIGYLKILENVADSIKNIGKPFMVLKPDSLPLEFSYIEIKQYGDNYKNREYETYSKLLDAFYTERDTAARISSAAHDIIKLLNNLKSRTEKKLALRLNELKQCENRETFRIYGELLKANLYNIKNGSKFALVSNYYDPEMTEIKIPLNPALSPSKNAEKYFKDYKKTYTAEQTLTALTEADKKELIYFDSVLDSINRATTFSEINEIREELAVGGYIKKVISKQKKKHQTIVFKEEVSVEGFRILIGKNNIQNDYLTTKLASKNDMWFHVKNIAGSHVVVFCDGRKLADETILKAAIFAAQNSKAAFSTQVPVDYTQIRNVKKPNGAKPGMVIYTTNKTIYVNPTENL